MGFELRTLDFDDISRAQKENVRLAEALGSGDVYNDAKRLQGVTSEQRKRNSEVGDLLNIGSGTRC